eukprot:gnl/MRDRNA2_/MRDRNA2_222479_c0_seq1.p1 gnl/MRDRNA2_/MRDRNA2_222479_c0~~gnl/MRDRNA2_/MRDRNA2_222479_c0_seq1.p1  ORF type:complete len:100 (-),score=6.83 gnl/MRDRNA2_/MRDRNA2_222479_c0_seq1:330-629(-)
MFSALHGAHSRYTTLQRLSHVQSIRAVTARPAIVVVKSMRAKAASSGRVGLLGEQTVHFQINKDIIFQSDAFAFAVFCHERLTGSNRISTATMIHCVTG